MIIRRLGETTEELGVLFDKRFGFVSDRSEEQQVLRLVEFAVDGAEQKSNDVNSAPGCCKSLTQWTNTN